MDGYWDKFFKYCKTKYLPVGLIEITKEKIFIQNKNIYEINEEYIMTYLKDRLSVLKRYKENDNKNKTEKSIFEIKELNNIPSKDNFENLQKIISDNYLREITPNIGNSIKIR